MPNLCIIPARSLTLLCDRVLSPIDVIVLCSIGEHTDRNGEGSWASSRVHCEKTGINKSTFFRSAERLIDAGLVERESGKDKGQTSSYRILLDAPRVSPERDTRVSPQGDTPRRTGEIPLSPARDTTTINDPINDPPNETPSAGKALSTTGVVWEYRDVVLAEGDYVFDIEEMITRITKAGGTFMSFIAELYMARMGEHGYPKATPQQIGDAVRAYNANGAEINFRLFKAYLRDSLKPKEEKPRGTLSMKPDKSVARQIAIVLVDRLKKCRVRATVGDKVGHLILPQNWPTFFGEDEAASIKAIGPSRLLSDDDTGASIALNDLASYLLPRLATQ